MRYILTFQPLTAPLPHWQPASADRPNSPFRGTYQSTLSQLDVELAALDAVDVHLQVVVADSNQVRIDGQLRANARVLHPGVVLTIGTRRLGTLVYETDRYDAHWSGKEGWQENLRAIAAGLEALRKLDRYGIARRGQQYAGYREIGSGIAMPAPMTEAEAVQILRFTSDHPSPDAIATRYRILAKDLHPDMGGDPDKFRRLTEARDFLLGRPS